MLPQSMAFTAFSEVSRATTLSLFFDRMINSLHWIMNTAINFFNRIRRAIKPTHLVGLIMLTALWGFRHWNPPPLQTLQLKTFDFYQNLKPREPKDLPIPVVVIDIDETSLEKYGQWPWPRTLLAELVDRLRESGAGVVGFDVFFPEYDRMSPTLLAENMRGLNDALATQLRALPTTESVFADSMRKMRVVLGQGTLPEAMDTDSDLPVKAKIAFMGNRDRILARIPAFAGVLRNVPELESAALGLGMVALEPEIDGVIRRVNMAFRVGDQVYPTITLEIMRLALGQENLLFRLDQKAQTQSIRIRGLKQIGTPEIPTDARFRTWVHYRPHDPEKMYISAADVLERKVGPERLQNALTLIGTSALGLKDVRHTPLSGALPGVEVHAQLLEMMLTNSFLDRPPWVENAEVFAVVLVGIIMIVLVPLLGATYTLLFAVALIGGMIGFSWYAYTDLKVLVDAVYPSLSGLVLYMSLTYMNFIREERQKKQVRGAFSMYMSPALVEKLAEDPDLLRLGGEMKEMTLLFADIRGFTTISEIYKEHPESLTEFINKFLTPMTGVILEREGTIDKYMGDCIMAFWNAPLDDDQHPLHACDSALAMLKACDDVGVTVKAQAEERAFQAREAIVAAKERLEKGDVEAEQEIKSAEEMLVLAEKERELTVKIGIGLNTDICCVGNMGSDQRFDYSVLGDGVNLASRLEGQSKTYGVPVVIGEDTQKQAAEYACIELDLIQVKGQTRPTRIYGLLGDKETALSPDFIAYKELHDELLLAYRTQKWDEAAALSKECRELCAAWNNVTSISKTEVAVDQPRRIENATGLYDLFDERIAEYRVNSPADNEGNWDGIYVATTK